MADSDLWTRLWDELTPSDLPGDLEWVARTTSMEEARRLVEVSDSVIIYVPVGDRGDTMERLASHLSGSFVDRLQAMWGGTEIYVPSRRKLLWRYVADHMEAEVTDALVVKLANTFFESVGQVRRKLDEEIHDMEEAEASVEPSQHELAL